MKHRIVLGWIAAALIASSGTIALGSDHPTREGVRRDPLVGPHPNAPRESERPPMGVDRVDRVVPKGSPRGRTHITAPAAGVTTDRLDRRVRSGSPRGTAVWGGR
jgi:hypothetical protein